MGKGREKLSKDGQAPIGRDEEGKGRGGRRGRVRRSLAVIPSGHFSDPLKPGWTPLLHKHTQAMNRCFQARSFCKINRAAAFCVFRRLPGNTYVYAFLLSPSDLVVERNRKTSHGPNISA